MILARLDLGAWYASDPGGCFYCGARNYGPVVVVWSGTTGDIVLCSGCAVTLGVHLIGDGREAALAAGAPPWGHRAERVFLASLARRRR